MHECIKFSKLRKSLLQMHTKKSLKPGIFLSQNYNNSKEYYNPWAITSSGTFQTELISVIICIDFAMTYSCTGEVRCWAVVRLSAMISIYSAYFVLSPPENFLRSMVRASRYSINLSAVLLSILLETLLCDDSNCLLIFMMSIPICFELSLNEQMSHYNLQKKWKRNLHYMYSLVFANF